jgi:hypothetical protein
MSALRASTTGECGKNGSYGNDGVICDKSSDPTVTKAILLSFFPNQLRMI